MDNYFWGYAIRDVRTLTVQIGSITENEIFPENYFFSNALSSPVFEILKFWLIPGILKAKKRSKCLQSLKSRNHKRLSVIYNGESPVETSF